MRSHNSTTLATHETNLAAQQRIFYTKIQHCFWNLRRGTPVSLAKIERDKKVGILYLNAEERKAYQFQIQGNDFAYREGAPLNGTHHLLFGLDGAGNFYGKLGFEWKNYGRGYFGHGSFVAGGYLKAAGELLLQDGKLRYITSNSGHYLPMNRHMRSVLYHLHRQGVDLSEVILVLYKHKRSSPPSRGRYLEADFYNAKEFLEKHEMDCQIHNARAIDFKNEIQAIRDVTNAAISQPDSYENNRPHRMGLGLSVYTSL
jgi:hypothetical protein